MREIKFRAFSKYALSMDEVIEIDFDEQTVIIQFEDEDFLDRGLETATLGFDDIELMQYTGLKDKNGVEIYEGDILSSCLHQRGLSDFLLEVIFKNGSFGCIKKTKTDSYFSLLCSSNTEVEIIGNIYENTNSMK